jgi:hypothetical protein
MPGEIQFIIEVKVGWLDRQVQMHLSRVCGEVVELSIGVFVAFEDQHYISCLGLCIFFENRGFILPRLFNNSGVNDPPIPMVFIR